MVDDPFPQELNSIQEYHVYVSGALSTTKASIGEAEVTQVQRPQLKPEMVLYLRRSVLIMFCMAWGRFCHRHHYKTYKNDAIQEMILIRDCVVHHDLCVHKKLAEFLPGKYQLGQKIEVLEQEVDGYYNTLMSAFQEMLGKSQQSGGPLDQ